MDDLEWSEWHPFADAVARAPRVPGVYMAREGEDGPIIYIGMAGDRKGGGKPTGLKGRLTVYASGKGIASGLGEAVFDRALADPDWLRVRLVELETIGPLRAKHWGVEAFRRADLHIRWTTTTDRKSAAELEDRLVRDAGITLWNKASVRAAEYAAFVDTMEHSPKTVEPGGFADSPTAVTQPVTEVDLRKNQIRIPSRYQALFPDHRQSDLAVSLRGELVRCSWDPRTRPDRVRSGILRFSPGLLA